MGLGRGVELAVAVAVAVGEGVGVGVPQIPLTLTLSTRQPGRPVSPSEQLRQRTFTCWPTPASGRFTVVV